MSKQSIKQLFLFFLLGAVLLLIATRSPKPDSAAVYQKPLPAMVENTGTHLLWESLSHQFLTTVQ